MDQKIPPVSMIAVRKLPPLLPFVLKLYLQLIQDMLGRFLEKLQVKLSQTCYHFKGAG